MRISTRGEYGIRAMLDLALNFQQGPISLHSIAQRQAISEPYLEQLFTGLRKAGLVTSLRGVHGGYQLAREPAAIKLGEIIRVLEGPIDLMDCAAETAGETTCRNSARCATRLFWQKLRDSIVQVLDSNTLADLVISARELNKDSLTYYI